MHSEFYYNDAGQQISNLALSVKARLDGIEPGDETWPKDGYQGDYIREVARAYADGETVAAADRTIAASGNIEDVDDIQAFSVAWLRREQDQDLKAFDVNFDCYFLESSLYTSNAVEDTVNTLIANGHTYEQDDALWLRTTPLAMTKTGSCESARVATPILCQMWPITSINGSEVLSALSMNKAPITTAPSLAFARA